MSAPQIAMSSGTEKAAILLVLLGDEIASQIYSHLPRGQWRQVTRKVAELESIPPEVAAEVLDEYFRVSASQGNEIHGGHEFAERLVTRAFGKDEAGTLLENFVFADDENARDFAALQEAEPGRLAECLEAEHPQTIALVLANLGSRAARVLKYLSEETRIHVVQRLASLKQGSPELLRKISAALNMRMNAVTDKPQATPAGAGARAVATLLNRLDPETGREILEAIRDEDSELATEISDLMFTFEDFLMVPVAGIREVISQIDKQTLALALRNASGEVQTHIFSAMSSRAVQMMKEDMEVMGTSTPADITAAQKEVVAVARKAEQDGKVNLRPQQNEEETV